MNKPSLRRLRATILPLAAAAITNACVTTPATEAEIIAAIRSSASPVPVTAIAGDAEIPSEVIDFLARFDVVMIGESHMIREHYEMMAQLIRQLHYEGLRQVLLEWPHSADWVLSEYPAGNSVNGWAPPRFRGRVMIDAIRDVNAQVSESERMAVRAIDVTLDEYGGAAGFARSFEDLAAHLDSSALLKEFVDEYRDPNTDGSNSIDALLEELVHGERTYGEGWGEARYRTVVEMLEQERVSIRAREAYGVGYERGVKTREAALKLIADRRIFEIDGMTLINIGGNHVQRRYLRGTRQE